ncbi:site-specific integrase [Xanthomonas rydalmerensis]|uniref:Site-specific integrase n=1 Tax=Xanthomonas rydalmerensis TaxID=3046274 RepID=A0ABZ0JLM6_9XANT|nr:site-specific integrase [Xanthomonas sp. DM-2023]WOS40707.1 site-specific integrase [Xanthomonas sp. DM-2023]WOS44891.1 site-specific integrase [Xanthomonas sp. DM-2023]WOS49071.1 site-specific integrase [Xanthomonas sp. DM-2023]WOS53251.1 site-specific integrase [Xanthomonas sp. DM-2023]WOS57434.1 site-specific integrase [Xanthomonas sp. DM-2023]
MASIRPQGNRYRAFVKVDGRRATKVFDTKRAALAWAQEQEGLLSGKELPDKTLEEAFTKYADEVTPSKRGGRWDRIRIDRFKREDKIAKRRLLGLSANDLAAWRDARLKQVKPSTVAREMNLIAAVLEVARREWGWLKESPMRDVRQPKKPKGRARRISAEEVEALARAFDVWDSLKAETKRHRIGLAFLFALETAMRSGEICALRWPDVHLEERYVTVRDSKNGDSRDVPLTMRAVQILRALPLSFGPAFGLDAAKRDGLFRKVRDSIASIKNLHFHDTRAEAIWRLSKKLDILELARVIGHRNLSSLLIYYRATAAELAKKLA